ncbi:MAG: hypothetical protein QMC96_08490 [Methanomicrobiales archaeon]|nr:hypothetical protein [Methanomicrobiales archaeon]
MRIRGDPAPHPCPPCRLAVPEPAPGPECAGLRGGEMRPAKEDLFQECAVRTFRECRSRKVR